MRSDYLLAWERVAASIPTVKVLFVVKFNKIAGHDQRGSESLVRNGLSQWMYRVGA
jgi:hypothetical protein